LAPTRRRIVAQSTCPLPATHHTACVSVDVGVAGIHTHTHTHTRMFVHVPVPCTRMYIYSIQAADCIGLYEHTYRATAYDTNSQLGRIAYRA
jgi:hypothetical protein